MHVKRSQRGLTGKIAPRTLPPPLFSASSSPAWHLPTLPYLFPAHHFPTPHFNALREPLLKMLQYMSGKVFPPVVCSRSSLSVYVTILQKPGVQVL